MCVVCDLQVDRFKLECETYAFDRSYQFVGSQIAHYFVVDGVGVYDIGKITMLAANGTWVFYESDKGEYRHDLLVSDYYDTWMFVSTD